LFTSTTSSNIAFILTICKLLYFLLGLTEVNKFKQLNCKSEEETIKNNVACTNYDLDFNIDDDLVDKLRELVITHIYKYHLVNINDDINNSSNDNGKNKTNFGRTTQQQPTSKE
jgi:hypothetical protein